MLRGTTTAFLLIVSLALPARAADLGEELLAAAKKGDAKAAKALLYKGAPVNAKNAYGATALYFAVRNGHLEVVKVLLQHKADVNAKDTFYKSAPLDWAVIGGRADIVKALVEAGAEGADGALLSAATQGNTEMVRAILDKGKLKPEALTKALAATPARHTKVAELLKKAGAKPPVPTTEVTVDAGLLASYAGTYRSDNIDLKIAVEKGKLSLHLGAGAAPPTKLRAIGKASFKSEDGSMTVTFVREGDKVTDLTLKFGTRAMSFRRGDSSKDPAPGKATIEDVGGVVKAPLNWPSFRGPHASGVADGQFPPLTWDAEKGVNIRWKTPIPGLGHSCPVVWGDRVYVTTADSSDGKATFKPGLYGNVESVKENTEHTWRVYCLDKRSGKVLWERTACKGVPKVKRHPKGSHANPTPATDGTHVVVSFGSEGLYCYDRDGKLRWQKSLGVLDSGWFFDADAQWGFGSSPVLYEGLVIVQCDVGKGSFVAAYRVSDGKEVWRKSREEIPSWGTPTIVEGPNRAELVTSATKYARGYDPRTGKELWRLGRHAEITVPTPFFGSGLIFITSGYSPVQPIYAVRPGASGDISLKGGKTANDAVAWSTLKGGPYMPTPIVYRDHLYICSNAGIVTCYEAKTGKQVYKERLGGRGGYTASPVAADGKIYFTSEESGIQVVRAGPKFELLAVNPLGDPCMATPAISDGMIFVRTQHYLFGIGRKAAGGPKSATSAYRAPGKEHDVLIRGGTVYDGSGNPPRRADVALKGDRIVAVGDLAGATAKTVVDARGQAVAPGFINMLSWSNDSLLADGRGQSEVRQGVTTQVMGEGWSWGPVNAAIKKRMKAEQTDIKYDIEWNTLGDYLYFLQRKGVSQNVASFLGATTVREYVLGLDNKKPTADELERMRRLVDREMRDGALGIATALEYAPAYYADTQELIELCKVAAKHKGKYISHMRSEGERLLEGIDELVRISREAKIPAEIYHFKAAGKENWKQMDAAIAKVEAARREGLAVTANMYGYTAGAAPLSACIPPWASAGGEVALRRRLRDPDSRKRVLDDIRNKTDWPNFYHNAGSPENLLLISFKQEALKPLQGKTLARIAKQRGKDPVETLLDLLVEDRSGVGTVYFITAEENIRKLVPLPWVSFGSDEAAQAPEGVFLKSLPHPRAYGNFARVLGKYVRDEKLLSLEAAVRKMTSLPATNLGLDRRGSLKEGYFADVVVFDPKTIADRATYEKPHQYAVGVRHVFVNGVQVLKDGEHTGALPGRALWGPGRVAK